MKNLLFYVLLFCSVSFISASAKEISSSPTSFSSIIPAARNFFDLQSYGTPQQIWQEPLHPENIHIVFTFSSQSSGFNDRYVAYYKTTDFGLNWSAENFMYDSVSDFGTISGYPSGEVIIGINSYSPGMKRTVIYSELISGLGVFNQFYTQGESGKYFYPRVAPISFSQSNPKYIFLTSSQNADSSFYYIFSDNPNARKFKPINARTEEGYSILKSTTGIIGIAYIARIGSAVNDYGDVYYMQSADEGNTFTSPLKIFDANFAGDSLGGFKGISISFSNSDPKVVFETVKQKTDGNYYPEAPSKIRFWSTNLPGSDPNRSIVIADSSTVPFAPAKGTLDMEAPLCRPSVGVTDKYVNCAFVAQTNRLGGTDNTSFNRIYITRSSNEGLTWNSTFAPLYTLNDETFPSLVPINTVRRAGLMTTFDMNMVYQRDAIPGSNITTNNLSTDAKTIYYRHMIYLYDPATLINPVNNATNVSLTPTFSWNLPSEYFTLQISVSPDFTSNVREFYGELTSQYTLPSGVLNINTRYYWRVYGSGSGINGQWSAASSFVTGTSGITQESGSIPDEYRLYTNYPNPFNPSTKIKYDLRENEFVSLVIFDIGGKQIETLVNEKQNAGSYSVDFNAASLPSGIYFYKLVTEKFSETKKMILIK